MTCSGRAAIGLIMASFVFAAGADLSAAARAAERPGGPRGGTPDWLIDPSSFRARASKDDSRKEVLITNGLIKRLFRLSPNAATVDFQNLLTGESILRAVSPEARIGISGRTFEVGGLKGQPERAYLLQEWLDAMTADPEAFLFKGLSLGEIEPRLEWRRTRPASDRPWPPTGLTLTLEFAAPASAGAAAGVAVAVHYELYDGLPLLCKWLSVDNRGPAPVTLDSFVSEILAAVESESSVENPGTWSTPNMHLESDYAFLGSTARGGNKTAHWLPDPAYQSQVNYRRQTPCLLECRPPLGPAAVIAPGESFESFRTFELVFDSTDRERKGLALCRMYRTIAPWVTENPILMHLRSTDPAVVRTAVDQCAETGFEMVVLSFGSGLDMEDDDPANIAKFRELADYAHARGIEIGGYSLLASRSVGPGDDVIDPVTGKTGGGAFGDSPCLGSRWGRDYFRKIRSFLEATGFDLLEHDGSYPGDVCASADHPGHKGLEDSQWTQWTAITGFYRWCRGRGIFLNVPDWYFLSGSNKTPMGYRETNWSLPRDRQIILGRQNIFDGTWEKTPAMGWMFVPLVEYQGGGAAATLEPLAEHLEAYEAHLAQNFLSGVQACYRGTRLYDTDETRRAVKKWVDLYKKHRRILDSDIVHLRRPDGRDIDGFLHVDPEGEPRGLAVFHNPTGKTVARTFVVPLYYTGLGSLALVREQDGPAVTYELDRDRRIRLPVRIGPGGRTWFTVESPS